MDKTLPRIGIVGAGFIGRAVGRLCVKAGHDVMISNSRGPRTLASTMISVGCRIGTVQDAVAFADLILLAVPFSALADLPSGLLRGKIVMDAGNYYPQRDGAVAELDSHSTTTSEMTARHFEGARVVKAFNAILERDLETDPRAPGAADRRALPIAGDDAQARQVVAALLDRIGYDVVDAGALSEGWRFERARPAYCVRLQREALVQALADTGPNVAEGAWRA